MWLLAIELPTEGFIGVNFWTIIFAWINLFILYVFTGHALLGGKG